MKRKVAALDDPDVLIEYEDDQKAIAAIQSLGSLHSGDEDLTAGHPQAVSSHHTSSSTPKSPRPHAPLTHFNGKIPWATSRLMDHRHPARES